MLSLVRFLPIGAKSSTIREGIVPFMNFSREAPQESESHPKRLPSNQKHQVRIQAKIES